MRTLSLASISLGIVAILVINLAGAPPAPVEADELARLLAVVGEQTQYWIRRVAGILSDWFANRGPVPPVR